MKSFKKMLVFIITIGTLGFIQSCECVVKPPCNGEFSFKIVDKFSHQDLVFGSGARYNPDSIKVLDTNDSIPTSFIQASQNKLYCYINGPGDTLYLRLNATDTDTLLLSFRNTKRTTCCPSGGRDITQIKFNNLQTKQDSLAFVFEK